MSKDHLQHQLLHFTSGKAWRTGDVPMYTKGDGCYLWDDNGRKYFDGLAGLFVVQVGHGRADFASAAAKQMETLAYTPAWSATHPTANECAKLIADLAPGDLDTVFFVSSGSEAVESAIKFARQYHRARGNPTKTGVVSRSMAYHGTTMGALSATGLRGITEMFEPLLPGFVTAPNTLGESDGVAAAAKVEEVILEAGPENIGLLIAEPVQNGGGAIVPPAGYWEELRRICDTHDILLHADEVINSFGRLGTWFGADYVGVVPDLVSFAKGASSGYAPVGGLLLRSEIVDVVMESDDGGFLHGATWGGHPVSMAVSIANITALRDEKVLENVRANEAHFAGSLTSLRAAHDVISDVRGTGYFYAVELCHTDGSRVADPAKMKEMVGRILPGAIRTAGLLIRADNRGSLKLMLSPPLVATRDQLDELVTGVDQVVSLAEAALAPV